MALGISVWDHDVYYYKQVSEAFKNLDLWHATNNYTPLFFGWIWGVVRSESAILFLNAIFGLGSVLAVMLLARNVKISAIKVGLLVAFQASLMRYGAQPLPDTLFLFFHCFLLAELTQKDPRRKIIFLLAFSIPWIRYDGLIFYLVYPVWALCFGKLRCPAFKTLFVGMILSFIGLVGLEHARHGDWLPTVRFASLYPSVGEDQIVGGETLWHVLANEGGSPPQLKSEDVQAARQELFGRETENAQVVTLFKNYCALLFDKLWQREQLSWCLLPLIILGIFVKPNKKIVYVSLFALLSLGIYSFLGVRERYLAFSIPFWLLLAARGLEILPWKKLSWWFLIMWLVWQLKLGSYHHRHPEVMLVEHKLAGQWIKNQGHFGSIMGREGVSSLYAGYPWSRLPTSNKEKLVEYVQNKNINWVVAGTRTLPNKRPWQTWLLDPTNVPWKLAKTFKQNVEGVEHKLYVYRVD